MAGNYNKVLLLGNLTRDVELRYLPNTNTPVAKVGLAVNRRFKTANGEQREETTFVDCEAMGRTAEVMSQYLQKGRPVFIEGRLRLDQWEDRQSGQKRSKLLVFIESFQFVDSGGSGPGGGGGSGGGGAGSSSGSAPARRGAYAGGSSHNDAHEPIDDDDIPF